MYRTKPFFREMIWGSERLNELFSVPVGEYPLGEVWILSGLEPNITPLIDEDGREIEPTSRIAGLDAPRFPLLLKVIAPSRWLSIQVHPDDELAKKLDDEPWGKTEGWYFVGGGKIALGRSKDAILKAMKDGIWDDALLKVEMNDGDFLYLPAGVVHTLGPDSLVVEVQQTSDMTYRIYDWGRPRELHLEKAKLAIKDFNVEKLVHRDMRSFECDHFKLKVLDSGRIEGFSILVFLEDGKVEGLDFRRFEVCVVEKEEKVSFQGKALKIDLGRFWKRFHTR